MAFLPITLYHLSPNEMGTQTPAVTSNNRTFNKCLTKGNFFAVLLGAAASVVVATLIFRYAVQVNDIKLATENTPSTITPPRLKRLVLNSKETWSSCSVLDRIHFSNEPAFENCVLGATANMPAFEAAPFVDSWQIHSPNTVVFLFVDRLYLPSYQELFDQKRYPSVKILPLFASCLPAASSIYVKKARYYVYQAFLQRLGSQHCKNVILSDVRDVVVQRNPFNYPLLQQSKDVPFVYGQEGNIIRNSPFNTEIVEKCSDTNTLDAIKEKPILCSGVSIGSRKNVQIYLSLMVYLFEKVGGQCKGSEHGDQGAHILVGYKSHDYAAIDPEYARLAQGFNSTILGSATELLWTMAYAIMNSHEIRTAPPSYSAYLDKDFGWRMHQPNDIVVPYIVHQYDRDSDLQQKVSGFFNRRRK